MNTTHDDDLAFCIWMLERWGWSGNITNPFETYYWIRNYLGRMPYTKFATPLMKLTPPMESSLYIPTLKLHIGIIHTLKCYLIPSHEDSIHTRKTA
ncbi:MAG: hypothetical protein V7L31_23065 [Nostoc sp.]|uniref:hypothetical protein n=1 Tax=Nostoc sp. TaxID=1180 RepID=UPI002FF2136B